MSNEAPDEARVAAVRVDVARALTGFGEERFYLRVLKPGRATHVPVHVLVRVDGHGLTVDAADAWREKNLAALAPRHTPPDLDLVFMSGPFFAAPGLVVRSVEDLTSRGLRPRA